jgi:hypothetical protein
MNSNVSIGSIVYGAANIGCKVLEIDGETLTIETDSGECFIPFSRVVRVEPPSLIDRLSTIATLDKPDAIEGLTDLLGEFTADDIYHTSLSIDTFPGIFVRGWLADVEASAE